MNSRIYMMSATVIARPRVDTRRRKTVQVRLEAAVKDHVADLHLEAAVIAGFFVSAGEHQRGIGPGVDVARQFAGVNGLPSPHLSYHIESCNRPERSLFQGRRRSTFRLPQSSAGASW